MVCLYNFSLVLKFSKNYGFRAKVYRLERKEGHLSFTDESFNVARYFVFEPFSFWEMSSGRGTLTVIITKNKVM